MTWNIPYDVDAIDAAFSSSDRARRFADIIDQAIKNGTVPPYVRDFVHDYGFEVDPIPKKQEQSRQRTTIEGIHRNCARIVGTDRDGWDQANPPFIEVWFREVDLRNQWGQAARVYRDVVNHGPGVHRLTVTPLYQDRTRELGVRFTPKP